MAVTVHTRLNPANQTYDNANAIAIDSGCLKVQQNSPREEKTIAAYGAGDWDKATVDD